MCDPTPTPLRCLSHIAIIVLSSTATPLFGCRLPPLMIVISPLVAWWREIAGAGIICTIRDVVVVISALAFVFLLWDAVEPAIIHLTGATALALAFARCVTGFCKPLKPPALQEGGRVGEGRMTSSRQRWRHGQRPPRLPLLSTTTIVAIAPPHSSSAVAIAILLLGCDAAMRSLGGEEVKIDPASAKAVIEEAPGHCCGCYRGDG